MKRQYIRKGLEVINSQRFTNLCAITYGPTDSDETRTWEMSQRTTRTIPAAAFQVSPAPIPVDAVEICATLKRADGDHLILVAQYRPPLDRVILEFPAGLVDPNEKPETAALRELHEETGYIATEDNITFVSPPICPEPGISDTSCLFVRITVDGHNPSNVSPQQQLDEGEDIEVVLLNISSKQSIFEHLNTILAERSSDDRKAMVDAKLYTYLCGLAS